MTAQRLPVAGETWTNIHTGVAEVRLVELESVAYLWVVDGFKTALLAGPLNVFLQYYRPPAEAWQTPRTYEGWCPVTATGQLAHWLINPSQRGSRLLVRPADHPAIVAVTITPHGDPIPTGHLA